MKETLVSGRWRRQTQINITEESQGNDFFLLDIFNMCMMLLSDLILSLGQNKYSKTGYWKLRS